MFTALSRSDLPVYCISLDEYYEVQWRRVKLRDFYAWSENREAPQIVFSLRVEAGASAYPYGVSTLLEVWQSVDDSLILAVTAEGLTEDRETSRLCRVVVAPSPMFDGGGIAAAVTSLSFEFGQHVNSQKMEKWQLLQLVNKRMRVYHLLINAGTAVHVLVFHARKRREAELSTPPRGLGISHFPQSTPCTTTSDAM
ncbi:hypothetical protein PInf_002882 [Phytophthora infestans]|nr:hypothetical protein PInf_002882 [Phytophthora infestans]